MKKIIAFWIWHNLSGGRTPFYSAKSLARFQSPVRPNAADWYGLKLILWNKAQDYLVRIGELTYTPTLSEKF